MKITMTTGWLVTMTMLAVAALLPAESSAQGLFGTLQALQAENTQGLPLGTLVDTAPTNPGRSLRGPTVRDAASQSRTDTSHAMTQGIVTHNGTNAGRGGRKGLPMGLSLMNETRMARYSAARNAAAPAAAPTHNASESQGRRFRMDSIWTGLACMNAVGATVTNAKNERGRRQMRRPCRWEPHGVFGPQHGAREGRNEDLPGPSEGRTASPVDAIDERIRRRDEDREHRRAGSSRLRSAAPKRGSTRGRAARRRYVSFMTKDALARLEALPDVLTLRELARVLRCSESTIKRRLRAGVFPIPTLRGVDKRMRFAKTAVVRYLDSNGRARTPRA